jgi:phosphatidylserine/phosphatidylglycerophosphate/cardiolipin synthase-like enzyme
MDPLLAFDKTVGDAVERLVRNHHHRRLRRIGWEHSLELADDRLWTAGEPPPREGNAIEALVDGHAVIGRSAERRLPHVLVLPADPNNGADDTRGQLADLLECDGGAGRVLACTLTALGERGPCHVYVHAKIGIVDDRWLTLGSANLNEHSLFNDTEVNVVCCDPDLARRTRIRLRSEHLERREDEVSGDATQVIDELWRPAEEQRRRHGAGEPPTHRLSQLPHLSRRTRRLMGPLSGLLVDG